MNHAFQKGFTTLDKEVILDDLPVQGEIPHWLTGTLVRNGPAQFEVGARSFNHWFDGYAMLHKFSFANGRVSYANKYLQSDGYKLAQKHGKIMASEFATDPCRSLFQRAAALFSPQPSHNTNVNLTRLANKFVAMTETPLPVEFDLNTLATLGIPEFQDELGFGSSTAHPHYDPVRRAAINQIVMFGRHTSYTLFAILDDRMERQVIGTIPVAEPGYMHSFGMTKNYLIVTEGPLVVNPLKLALASKPFIENYEWKPERNGRFFVMRKADGEVVQTYQVDPFFTFHHVNAYEAEGEIIVDLLGYDDATLVQDLYLKNLRGEAGGRITPGQFRRYHLPINGDKATFELLSEVGMELPRINYGRVNGKMYRYVYAGSYSQEQPYDFMNQLVKLDVETKQTTIWREEGCYPGEPIFVATPQAEAEDNGLILSVVLDGESGTSFLLVLDAASFSEIGRAAVSHHIPFGFHGQYFR